MIFPCSRGHVVVADCRELGKLLAFWSFLIEIGNAAIWEVSNIINFISNFTNIVATAFVILIYVGGIEKEVLVNYSFLGNSPASEF